MRATILAMSAAAALICDVRAEPTLPAGFQVAKDRSLAPNTTLLNENGATETIGAFGGKVIVLNFWATWCPPCVKEIPSLERLAQKLPEERFAVLALSQDKGGVVIAKIFCAKLVWEAFLCIWTRKDKHTATSIFAAFQPRL